MRPDRQAHRAAGSRDRPAGLPDISAELERADGGLRAGQLCQILDVGTEAKHREGMRQKLKRLAARGILTETEPGLFVLVATTPPRPPA